MCFTTVQLLTIVYSRFRNKNLFAWLGFSSTFGSKDSNVEVSPRVGHTCATQESISIKTPWLYKRSGQELKKGLDKKEVKSKLAAKACVVLYC